MITEKQFSIMSLGYCVWLLAMTIFTLTYYSSRSKVIIVIMAILQVVIAFMMYTKMEMEEFK